VPTPVGYLPNDLEAARAYRDGKIVVDDDVDLPEGIEVRLTLVDDADDLDSEDRFRLHADLDQSQAEIDRGEGFPASEVIAGLRNRGR